MTEKNIYQKLQACRVELQNSRLKKSGENKFAKFKYYELSDLLPTINVLMDKYGLCSMFGIENEKANLFITDGVNEIIFTSPIAEAELKGCTPVQSLGAIHTYLKRYLYLNAFEIVEADILDAVTGQENIIEKPKNKAPVKESEAKEIEKQADFSDMEVSFNECKTTKELTKWFNDCASTMAASGMFPKYKAKLEEFKKAGI